MSLTDSETQVIEYVSASWLHRSFKLPATDTHGPLRVTYAVAGLDDANAKTVLLIGGMFGGRWLALSCHHLALKMGVRVICIDR
jgi:hypothetical protein